MNAAISETIKSEILGLGMQILEIPAALLGFNLGLIFNKNIL